MKSTFRDPLDPLVSQVWEGCMIQGKGSEDISGEMRAVWTVPPRTPNVLEITAHAWLQSEFFFFFFNNFLKLHLTKEHKKAGKW
jgi:hypothetical protein